MVLLALGPLRHLVLVPADLLGPLVLEVLPEQILCS
jgi:hypothetical protein